MLNEVIRATVGASNGLKPRLTALRAERERRLDQGGTAGNERSCSLTDERLSRYKACSWTDRWHITRLTTRIEVNVCNSKLIEQTTELVFDNVRDGTKDNQILLAHL